MIIIGMHRSGTTMIAGMLARLGLFTGWRLDGGNSESVFFTKNNESILSAGGCRWDSPDSFKHVLNRAESVELLAESMRRRLSSPASFIYLGIKMLLTRRSIFNIDSPWGWKDPRNTITLPIWLKLFPEAKIIHIIRNGVDVADSLKRRERRALGKIEKMPKGALYNLGITDSVKIGSPKVARLEGGFELWEEYLEFAETSLASLPNEVATIRFEDFIGDSPGALARLASFCGLGAGEGAISSACRDVRKDRANIFARDSVLRSFWENVRESRYMVKHGYRVKEERR
ncbi:hypothetical protein MNBD_NITROSPINAE02-1403 [hydrothermal vent metagenome]|uniref:Sulfotransferase n=1 Tax=hydrothermal vent metagenome TaxID=652676 RepID=A0A3B1C6T3_9ZZZZ